MDEITKLRIKVSKVTSSDGPIYMVQPKTIFYFCLIHILSCNKQLFTKFPSCDRYNCRHYSKVRDKKKVKIFVDYIDLVQMLGTVVDIFHLQFHLMPSQIQINYYSSQSIILVTKYHFYFGYYKINIQRYLTFPKPVFSLLNICYY